MIETYLVGGIPTYPSEKWWSESQWEGWHHIYEMENNVPNHRPVIFRSSRSSKSWQGRTGRSHGMEKTRRRCHQTWRSMIFPGNWTSIFVVVLTSTHIWLWKGKGSWESNEDGSEETKKHPGNTMGICYGIIEVHNSAPSMVIASKLVMNDPSEVGSWG